MPSALPGGVYTPAHIRLGMALEEMTNAKGMGAVERLNAPPGQEVGSSHISNSMYCLKATAWASSVRYRTLMRAWDTVISVLPIQRPSSSQSPFQILLSQKWKQKIDCKAWEVVRALLFRTAISYPARKGEPEREGGRDNTQRNLLPQINLLD